MSLPQNLTDLLESFSEISDIKEKFQFLLEISEDLPEFSEELKIEKNKIQGCASDAWIVVKNSDFDIAQSPDSVPIEISGTGDALISKGMIAFFREAFSGLTASEILEIQNGFPEIFLESGVITSLSPSRANGAKAMLQKIYSECEKISG